MTVLSRKYYDLNINLNWALRLNACKASHFLRELLITNNHILQCKCELLFLVFNTLLKKIKGSRKSVYIFRHFSNSFHHRNLILFLIKSIWVNAHFNAKFISVVQIGVNWGKSKDKGTFLTMTSRKMQIMIWKFNETCH